MWRKRKKEMLQKRAAPVAMWLNGEDAHEILCPKRYMPLSKNEEIIKCASKIADLVSSMTIMLMENKENGDVRIKNELSKKLDISPCKNMTRKGFIYKIVYDMVVRGNSVAYPVIENGLISNICLWDMDSVFFRELEDSYTIHYKTQVFSPDEVLHFSFNPDAKKPFQGQGFVPAVKETVTNLIQANTTKTGFLQSKWKPGMILFIQSDNELLFDMEKRQALLGSYTKTTEAGEPWVMPADEIKIETVKPLTLNDLAIQDSITLDKKAIASAFGIPAFMLGVGEFQKEEYNNFIATTILSVAMEVQQELTRKLLHHPNWYFKFNPKSLMQYDLNEKTEFIKAMVSGGMMSRNEGRNEFDYAPQDNEGMNDFIVLENYIPVANVGDQKKLNDNKAE